jgi:hypothetical protein
MIVGYGIKCAEKDQEAALWNATSSVNNSEEK